MGWLHSKETGRIEGNELFERAAAAGNRKAMFYRGLFCEHGMGARTDYAKARHWYRAAANLDDPKALYKLGYLYQEGLGVEKILPVAKYWYWKAVKAGNADATDRVNEILVGAASGPPMGDEN